MTSTISIPCNWLRPSGIRWWLQAVSSAGYYLSQWRKCHQPRLSSLDPPISTASQCNHWSSLSEPHPFHYDFQNLMWRMDNPHQNLYCSQSWSHLAVEITTLSSSQSLKGSKSFTEFTQGIKATVDALALMNVPVDPEDLTFKVLDGLMTPTNN